MEIHDIRCDKCGQDIKQGTAYYKGKLIDRPYSGVKAKEYKKYDVCRNCWNEFINIDKLK